MAEALVEIFCHVCIPKEVLRDRGTQFTLAMMDEPFQTAVSEGAGILPGILRAMASARDSSVTEQPKEWSRYVAPFLFAHREAPQSTLMFSSFELLYGRAV